MIDDTLRTRASYQRRRTVTRSRRLRLRVGSRLHPAGPPVRPVFILGCPRSGTSLLYALLRRHEGLASPTGEGHLLWNAYQHPRLKDWSSDRATQEDIKPGERDFLYGAIRQIAGGRRFLDKTPKNTLRLPYLAALFPGARFILLCRDAPATVASLIEGWEVRQSPSYRLPVRLNLAEYRGRLWSFVLPPGWQDLVDTTIAEVAAHQYASCYTTVLDDIERVPASVVPLRFEDLLERPEVEVPRLLDHLELPPSTPVLNMAADLASHPVQSNSPPAPDKWRRRAAEIHAVLPLTEPAARRLGYRSARPTTVT